MPDPGGDTPATLIDLIAARRTAPGLTTPGPTGAQLRAILGAATRVPDHGRLRPYRFVIVAGEARRRFGAALRAAAIHADADPVTVAKAPRKPLFGPLQVVIIASPRPHATVPQWEQELTAGLTGYAMELAAAAVGVGAAWKSGRHLDGEPVRRLFGMTPDERLLGWVNLGTTTTSAKPPKAEPPERPGPVVMTLRPDPLIGVEELAARIGELTLRVCDALVPRRPHARAEGVRRGPHPRGDPHRPGRRPRRPRRPRLAGTSSAVRPGRVRAAPGGAGHRH
ncbi:MAG: nitroreductase family protein [Chloroflexota bacterium]